MNSFKQLFSDLDTDYAAFIKENPEIISQYELLLKLLHYVKAPGENNSELLEFLRQDFQKKFSLFDIQSVFYSWALIQSYRLISSRLATLSPAPISDSQQPFIKKLQHFLEKFHAQALLAIDLQLFTKKLNLSKAYYVELQELGISFEIFYQSHDPYAGDAYCHGASMQMGLEAKQSGFIPFLNQQSNFLQRNQHKIPAWHFDNTDQPILLQAALLFIFKIMNSAAGDGAYLLSLLMAPPRFFKSGAHAITLEKNSTDGDYIFVADVNRGKLAIPNEQAVFIEILTKHCLGLYDKITEIEFSRTDIDANPALTQSPPIHKETGEYAGTLLINSQKVDVYNHHEEIELDFSTLYPQKIRPKLNLSHIAMFYSDSPIASWEYTDLRFDRVELAKNIQEKVMSGNLFKLHTCNFDRELGDELNIWYNAEHKEFVVRGVYPRSHYCLPATEFPEKFANLLTHRCRGGGTKFKLYTKSKPPKDFKIFDEKISTSAVPFKAVKLQFTYKFSQQIAVAQLILSLLEQFHQQQGEFHLFHLVLMDKASESTESKLPDALLQVMLTKDEEHVELTDTRNNRHYYPLKLFPFGFTLQLHDQFSDYRSVEICNAWLSNPTEFKTKSTGRIKFNVKVSNSFYFWLMPSTPVKSHKFKSIDLNEIKILKDSKEVEEEATPTHVKLLEIEDVKVTTPKSVESFFLEFIETLLVSPPAILMNNRSTPVPVPISKIPFEDTALSFTPSKIIENFSNFTVITHRYHQIVENLRSRDFKEVINRLIIDPAVLDYKIPGSKTLGSYLKPYLSELLDTIDEHFSDKLAQLAPLIIDRVSLSPIEKAEYYLQCIHGHTGFFHPEKVNIFQELFTALQIPQEDLQHIKQPPSHWQRQIFLGSS